MNDEVGHHTGTTDRHWKHQPQGESAMKTLFGRLVREDEGQDLIEYALLLGIIVVAVITTISTIGGKVSTYFSNLNSSMP
jgi:pilus assembly protein Flp/PilA